LADEAKEKLFEPEIVDLKNFNKDILKEKFRGIFLMATHGEGKKINI